MNNDKCLVLGLGNPDLKYENNRHNAGSLFIDYLVQNNNIKKVKNKYSAVYKINLANKEIFLAKPYFFINESGIATIKLLEILDIEISKLIIVVDDMNLDLGEIRIRKKGKDGGHNGLKSIEYKLQSTEYGRLRIGIGSPSNKNDHIDYVLSDFTKNEKILLNQSIINASHSINEIIDNGFEAAMAKFN